MPITPELTQYISQARASGMSDDAIRTELLKTGWNINDVNEAIPPKIPSFAPVVALEQPTTQPVQAKPRRSHLGFIITVVLLLLIGGAVYYFLPQILLQIDKLTAKDTPVAIDDIVEPVAPIPADETASWQTCRNEKYGYELKYPTNWRVWEQGSGTLIPASCDKGDSLTVFSPDQSQLSFEIDVTNSERMKGGVFEGIRSVDEIFSRNPVIIEGNPILKDSLIDGEKLVRLENRYLYAFHNGAIFRFGSYDITTETLEQILSTFKFIPQATTTTP